jgi:beta propeller repeat protein
MVVWSEYQGYLQVRLANITSGLVTSLTSAASDHYNPVIFGDLVAYEEQGNYNRITLLDIATRKEMVISPARPDTDQDQPAVWEDRVVWRESREGFYDIYLATLGVSKPPLHVDFSVNTSEGHAPLPVLFTPNTTGEVTGYTWDFGDGDRSSERSPVHTYEIPGIYSPALTVNNPCQREKLTKSGFITIGSPPATMFSANATYGPAPLDVAFVDSSSGNPDAWSWDFGDGSNSTLQNPVHRYPAGNYSVSLTASSRWGTTTVTREDYIHALEVSRYMGRFPGEGITIKPLGGGLHLLLDTGKFLSFAIYQVDNTTVLDVVPPMDTGFSRMVFHSSDGTGFRETGYGTVEGNISGVAAISSDQAGGVVPGQFPWFYNLTQVIPGYPYGGSIGAVLWQNCTPGDLQRFDDTAMRNDYGVARVAYTLACTEEGIENASPASLQFGLDPDWIARNGWRWPVYVQSDPAGAEAFVDSRYVGVTPLYVDEGLATGEHNLTLRYNGYNNATTVFVVGDLKDSIAVLRIADDGSGSLLPDNYLGYDAARGLEIFEAESPGGLSRFGVVSLYQTGNPIQLLYLTLQMLTRGSIVSSGSVSTTGGGGGGGGGGGSIGGAAVSATPIPVATEVPSLEAVLPAATTEQPLREKVQAQAAPPAPQGTTGPTAAIPQSAAEYGSYTLVLVKNLAVVFVAVLVAVLLYLRWRKGGSGV